MKSFCSVKIRHFFDNFQSSRISLVVCSESILFFFPLEFGNFQQIHAQIDSAVKLLAVLFAPNICLTFNYTAIVQTVSVFGFVIKPYKTSHFNEPHRVIIFKTKTTLSFTTDLRKKQIEVL